MLEGILGGAAGVAGMIPGGQLLGVVAMGVELAKGLFDKGDMQGAQDALKFLNEVVSKLGQGGGGQAGEAMPFTNPMPGAGIHGMANANTLENKEFMKNARGSIDITIDFNAGGGAGGPQPINYGTLPMVDGSAAGDQQLSKAAAQRVDGDSGNRDRALKPGSDEWTTVMWAMQQNPAVRYNADTKEFTIKMSDGSDRQIATLAEAQSATGPSGLNRNQPVGMAAIGNLLNQRIDDAKHASPSADIEKLMQELKKLLKQFEDAQQMMQKSTVDITVNQAVA